MSRTFEAMRRMNAPEGWPEILAHNLPGFRIADAPETLTGGLMNHVWRVRGGPGSIPASVIIKRTPQYGQVRLPNSTTA